MARKVSLIVIWPSFKNKMATISRLMSNGIIPLKSPISPLSLLLGVRNVKTTYRKSLPGNPLHVKNFALIVKNKMATITDCFKII